MKIDSEKVAKARRADAGHISALAALADERAETLRRVGENATALANSLALVCGSSALPKRLRKPMAAVGEEVHEIAKMATEGAR